MTRRRPSPKVKKAAWALLDFVRLKIGDGMASSYFQASELAGLHDRLSAFIEEHDADHIYKPKRTGGGNT